jgi:hypothetical protein
VVNKVKAEVSLCIAAGANCLASLFVRD